MVIGLPATAADRRDAGAHRLAVDMHGAGAALAEAAAETRAVQAEIVAQRVEQRHRGVVDGKVDRLAVDGESNRRRHRVSPRVVVRPLADSGQTRARRALRPCYARAGNSGRRRESRPPAPAAVRAPQSARPEGIASSAGYRCSLLRHRPWRTQDLAGKFRIPGRHLHLLAGGDRPGAVQRARSRARRRSRWRR